MDTSCELRSGGNIYCTTLPDKPVAIRMEPPPVEALAETGRWRLCFRAGDAYWALRFPAQDRREAELFAQMVESAGIANRFVTEAGGDGEAMIEFITPEEYDRERERTEE